MRALRRAKDVLLLVLYSSGAVRGPAGSSPDPYHRQEYPQNYSALRTTTIANRFFDTILTLISVTVLEASSLMIDSRYSYGCVLLGDHHPPSPPSEGHGSDANDKPVYAAHLRASLPLTILATCYTFLDLLLPKNHLEVLEGRLLDTDS